MKVTYPNATTLLHLSGGQDSTYTAYHWLKDHPDETLLIHHVLLSHRFEDRLKEEKVAVTNILNYFKQNKLTNFIYEESSFGYGTLPRISIKDIQVVSVFSGIILRTPAFKNINTLLLSWHKGEIDDVEINRGFRVRNMLTALDCVGKIKLEFPLMNLTREDMANNMPIELLKLCACCRRPRNGKHYGTCKTCKELKEANIFHHFIQ